MTVPVITVSRAGADKTYVFSADFSLDGLQEFMDAFRLTPNGLLVLFDQQGRILATSPDAGRLLGEDAGVLGSPGERTRALVAAARTSRDRLPPDFSTHLISYRSWQAVGSGSIGILLAAPMSDFLGPLGNLRTDIILTLLAVVLVTIPLTILLTRKVSRMLVSLAADAERISRFDFGGNIPESSLIKEFNQLARGFGIMKETLAGRTEALDTTMEKLKTLIDLGGKLSSLRDIDQLCEEILRGAMGLTHAEGGSVYLRGTLEQKDKLEFKIVLNNKLVGFDQGGTSGKPVTLPPVPLYDAAGSPNVHNAVSDAFHAAKTINIPNADTYELHDLTGTRKFDKFTGYHTVSILTVPLKPLGREVIGALQLLNARNPETGEVIPFTQEIEDLVKALAAQAATALSNQRLINDLEALFEAMIKVIVEAIDAKSPYTGGHNARVPVIARMLADQAVQISAGPLAGWQTAFTNLDKQFHIAAMLHDCGKITTPEYVVDKASKLETIYNRIHEVRTRFEVLWRDAEIECLRAQAAGTPQAAAESARDAAQAKLRDDFAFVADCNLGGEFLAPERLERLKEIAARTWTRNFDDTLGLAWEELHRVPDSERVPLPATERLLSDKPRHRIPREPDSLKRYEELSFRVDIPELKYNLGEMYNLSVQRGTLTAEERFKINEHIMQTIVMLNNLCKNNDTLSQVVTWAGGHHETLKGTGYPYKKGGADLSVPARILAIADIFEALTAKDRPYKKAKTLSEAVKILAKFRDDGHIDPELFVLFLQSGVYRRYAEAYLSPEQIDEVDIAALLAPPAGPAKA